MNGVMSPVGRLNAMFNLFKHADNFKTITIDCNGELLYISKHIILKRAPKLLQSDFYDKDASIVFFKENISHVVRLLNVMTYGVQDETRKCLYRILFISYKYELSLLTEQILSYLDKLPLSLRDLQNMSFLDISIICKFTTSMRLTYIPLDENKLNDDILSLDAHFWQKIAGWFIKCIKQ
jgi:hypothetical protein